MEQFLQVGAITSTHGIRGEVKVFPTTDDPARFKKLKKSEFWIQENVRSIWRFNRFVFLNSL